MQDFTDDVATTPSRQRPWRRLAGSFVSADSYGLVLLLVMVTYVVSVSVQKTVAAPIVLTVQLATVWLTLRTSRARPATRLVADIGLAVAAVAAELSFFEHSPGAQLGGLFALICLLYLIAPFSIVRHLMIRRDIDFETLLGAIAAYALIGMFFAFAYQAIAQLQSQPFFGPSANGSLSNDLFFSFITMTTVGYGDLVPAGNPGQTLAVLEALTGQLFLVVAIGKIISSPLVRRGGRSGS